VIVVGGGFSGWREEKLGMEGLWVRPVCCGSCCGDA
jgi:hypothetical protein